MRRIQFVTLALAALVLGGCGTSNLAIRWNEESSHLVTRGGYARIKKVDNRHALVYGEKHTLLSVQSTEGRKGKGHKFANMQVYVGDKNARNFRNRSTPLPHLDENGHALWNSLAQIDDNTVIAVMSVGGMGRNENGIWTTKGKIVKR